MSGRGFRRPFGFADYFTITDDGLLENWIEQLDWFEKVAEPPSFASIYQAMRSLLVKEWEGYCPSSKMVKVGLRSGKPHLLSSASATTVFKTADQLDARPDNAGQVGRTRLPREPSLCPCRSWPTYAPLPAAIRIHPALRSLLLDAISTFPPSATGSGCRAAKGGPGTASRARTPSFPSFRTLHGGSGSSSGGMCRRTCVLSRSLSPVGRVRLGQAQRLRLSPRFRPAAGCRRPGWPDRPVRRRQSRRLREVAVPANPREASAGKVQPADLP